jgi:hypothetical protein
MTALVAGATVLAYRRSDRSVQNESTGSHLGISAAVVAITVGLSSAASAASGDWISHDYLINDARATEVAARGLLANDRCRVCFTSRNRAIDWKWPEPNPARRLDVNTTIDRLSVTIHARVDGDEAGTGFGRMRVDFGDGSESVRTGIVGTGEVSHRYPRAGEYSVTVWLDMRNGSADVSRHVIRVQP